MKTLIFIIVTEFYHKIIFIDMTTLTDWYKHLEICVLRTVGNIGQSIGHSLCLIL